MESQPNLLAKETLFVDNVQKGRMIESSEETCGMSESKKASESLAFFSSYDSLADLVRRSREGDTTAMEAIYLQFKKPLFNLAYRYTYDRATAEDLLQEIFLKIFTHMENVQRIETFVGWVYRIALNTCYSYLRRKRTELQRKLPLSEVEGIIGEETDSYQEASVKEHLEAAIERLPHKLKRIFLLHDVQGFKHEEIARLLGLSVGTSKSQLFKARMRVRDFLKNKQIY